MLTEDDDLTPPDTRIFWSAAATWMWRVSLSIAVCKVVATLIWCGLNGIGVRLAWWWNIIPHFELELDSAEFVKVVTLSTWLGVAGMAAGLAWAAFVNRRSRTDAHHHDHDEHHGMAEPATPADPHLLTWYGFLARSERAGAWLGAWTGALCLLVTIAFELIRDRLIDTYVWPHPHLAAITLAAIPLAVLVGTALFDTWRRPTPVKTVEQVLVAGGVTIQPATP
jgi:hypothetical protein